MTDNSSNSKMSGFNITNSKIELVMKDSKYIFKDIDTIKKYIIDSNKQIPISENDKQYIYGDSVKGHLGKLQKDYTKAMDNCDRNTTSYSGYSNARIYDCKMGYSDLNDDIQFLLRVGKHLGKVGDNKLSLNDFFTLMTLFDIRDKKYFLTKYIENITSFPLKIIYLTRNTDNSLNVTCYGISRDSPFVIIYETVNKNIFLIETKTGVLRSNIVKYKNYLEYAKVAADLAILTSKCSNAKVIQLGGSDYYDKYMKYKQKYLQLKNQN